MKIAFTGHRDRVADYVALLRIANEFPRAVWVHGGAAGFDSQVDQFARRAGIPTEVFRPEYATYGKSAPLVRNREIIRSADLVVALYDGRQKGGTFHAIGVARQLGKPIRFLRCA